MRACHCTNQCRTCGACCAAGCAHRGVARPIETGSVSWPWPRYRSLTEDDVRRIIREELDRK